MEMGWIWVGNMMETGWKQDIIRKETEETQEEKRTKIGYKQE